AILNAAWNESASDEPPPLSQQSRDWVIGPGAIHLCQALVLSQSLQEHRPGNRDFHIALPERKRGTDDSRVLPDASRRVPVLRVQRAHHVPPSIEVKT